MKFEVGHEPLLRTWATVAERLIGPFFQGYSTPGLP